MWHILSCEFRTSNSKLLFKNLLHKEPLSIIKLPLKRKIQKQNDAIFAIISSISSQLKNVMKRACDMSELPSLSTISKHWSFRKIDDGSSFLIENHFFFYDFKIVTKVSILYYHYSRELQLPNRILLSDVSNLFVVIKFMPVVVIVSLSREELHD